MTDEEKDQKEKERRKALSDALLEEFEREAERSDRPASKPMPPGKADFPIGYSPDSAQRPGPDEKKDQ